MKNAQKKRRRDDDPTDESSSDSEASEGGEFETPGTVLWAKLAGYAWWPSRVGRPDI